MLYISIYQFLFYIFPRVYRISGHGSSTPKACNQVKKNNPNGENNGANDKVPVEKTIKWTTTLVTTINS